MADLWTVTRYGAADPLYTHPHADYAIGAFINLAMQSADDPMLRLNAGDTTVAWLMSFPTSNQFVLALPDPDGLVTPKNRRDLLRAMENLAEAGGFELLAPGYPSPDAASIPSATEIGLTVAATPDDTRDAVDDVLRRFVREENEREGGSPYRLTVAPDGTFEVSYLGSDEIHRVSVSADDAGSKITFRPSSHEVHGASDRATLMHGLLTILAQRGPRRGLAGPVA